MSKANIIVIDGPDGTGKATVTKNVLKLLNKRKPLGKLEVLTQSFPNYPEFYGRQVRAYLDGDSADPLVRVPTELRQDPIASSVPYAMDRYQTFTAFMKSRLDQGHWYLCDRYYTSNMGHQGSKMETDHERLDFFNRLMRLELGYLEIPEPSLVIILDLPDEVRERRTKVRRQQALDDGVLSGQVSAIDIHEQDADHMRRATDVYRLMSDHFNWPLVSGAENEYEFTPSQMAERVYDTILTALR